MKIQVIRQIMHEGVIRQPGEVMDIDECRQLTLLIEQRRLAPHAGDFVTCAGCGRMFLSAELNALHQQEHPQKQDQRRKIKGEIHDE